MFVHVVTELWVATDPEGGSTDDVLAVFASAKDAESLVWRMEEEAEHRYDVKAGYGTYRYYVTALPVIPEDAEVKDYA